MESEAQFSSDLSVLPVSLIEPLCQPFARQADPLLDLYELSRSKSGHPGRCLRCFYDLLGAASPSQRPVLQPLREWIESNLVISCRDESGWTGAMLPVELDEPDLESFCERTMRNVYEDGVSRSSRLELEVCFKRQAA